MSCATKRVECDVICEAEKRRQSYVQTNPQLPERIKTAILTGNVVIGMSKQDVAAVLGEPDASVDINAHWVAREQWVYESEDGSPKHYYFKFGKLNSWKHDGH